MPTYQYRCTECGRELEVVQKFSDAALKECPNCSGALRKVFNAVGVVFKGSGFYRTDSRKKVTDGASSGSANGKDSANGKESKKTEPVTVGSSTDGGKKSKGDSVPVGAGSGSSSSTGSKPSSD
ncbi:MAG TPA: FmdB family zinc ribbon protein [Propionibacteriaceae bacterium]|nr:FmdB family zinc ribbon protein [Propionibacteriaceae bacterium]